MEYAPPVRRLRQQASDLGGFKPELQAEFEKLDPAVRYLWILSRMIFWTIVTFGAFFVAIISKFMTWVLGHPLLGILILLGYGALATLHIFWPFISYPRWGYALRKTDLLIRSGVLFKTVIAVPFNRIQHVDSSAGPLTRSMGMAQLMIHTAGSQMGSVGIPGLPAERAEILRDYLSHVGHSHANI